MRSSLCVNDISCSLRLTCGGPFKRPHYFVVSNFIVTLTIEMALQTEYGCKLTLQNPLSILRLFTSKFMARLRWHNGLINCYEMMLHLKTGIMVYDCCKLSQKSCTFHTEKRGEICLAATNQSELAFGCRILQF